MIRIFKNWTTADDIMFYLCDFHCYRYQSETTTVEWTRWDSEGLPDGERWDRRRWMRLGSCLAPTGCVLQHTLRYPLSYGNRARTLQVRPHRMRCVALVAVPRGMSRHFRRKIPQYAARRRDATYRIRCERTFTLDTDCKLEKALTRCRTDHFNNIWRSCILKVPIGPWNFHGKLFLW